MIRALADEVRARRVGARELVERSLERIGARDPELNAVVALRADEALAEARALDERLAAAGSAGVLAGLPLLVKDITDVTGMRTTHGSLLFADAPPATTDALVVARLRAAGAIVVGKTNTPEFACAGFTTNLVFGTTRNPWNPAFSPGGSSGGSAVAVAAGMAPIATATDTGGSVRIPAAYCGIVGLKPTSGAIPRDPAARATDWIDLTTDGPIGATVDDVRLLFEVLTGSPRPRSSLIRPSRTIVFERWIAREPPPDLVAPFAAAVDAFAGLGGPAPEPGDPSALFGGDSLDEEWGLLAAPELLAIVGGRTALEEEHDLLHPATDGFARLGAQMGIDTYLDARRRRFALTDALTALLGEDGVIVSPTMAGDAPPADGPVPIDGDVDAGIYDNVVAQNLTGFPAISLPAGLAPSGVPFGLQVTAPPNREDLLLAIAEAWQDARPWPLTAPGFDPFWEGR
ncbi:MAG TPA: amidase [Actinomycetota bacterium]|nr:amidase [Actinomycetota bacterium]